MGNTLRRLKRTLSALKTPWCIIGVTLVVLFMTEATLRAVFAVRDRLMAPSEPDPQVIAEGYGGEAWPVTHYRELQQLSDRWEPYAYFRQRPFSGQTIAIDPNGLRRTWRAASDQADRPEARPYKVLMLGGSSLWGFGARDDHTIPSLVARKLFERGCRVEIRNLAEIGYVSTQEVVALVRELQAGYRPDVVIFYDGVNDTASALLEAEAGLTTNEKNRRAEFNIRQSAARLSLSLLGRLVQDSAMSRLARVISHRLAGAPVPTTALPAPGQRGQLAADVVRHYQANLALVDQLGRGFGFQALYYWQPVVFFKRSVTPTERAQAAKLGWAREFIEDVYHAIRSSEDLAGHRRFHDLSGLFAESDELVFIDYCHTTERANDVVAELIARDASALLQPGAGAGDRQAAAVR